MSASSLPRPSRTLQFSVDDPCNTIIIDKTSGRTLYIVDTNRISISATSDLRIITDVYDSERRLIASLRWKDIVSDVVTMPSKSLEEEPLSKWLKKSINPFKQTATFKDKLGRKYKWDTKGLRLQFRVSTLSTFEDLATHVSKTPTSSWHPMSRKTSP
ncbi:hypothetical protein SCHPADRAFT_900837 [Schizopora paradoxa]|uniref:DUF6593 domain-containing protein n=1 Tax=Schizopora paradoxa TaxID=27342 RepID=A0A0H2SJB8_9AGAM|nr:hypothetical protein SCHPADRAFT_900837 [Schizopora paradoxa]